MLGICAAACGAQSDTQAAKQQDRKTQQPAERTGTGGDKPPVDSLYQMGGQATFTLQNLIPFHNPYEGPNSLPSRGEAELTHTYTLFLGARFTKNVEIYLNPEVALGNGLNGGTGLAGYPNGEVIGQGGVPTNPYLARYFVRWRTPVGHFGGAGTAERIGRSQNINGGVVPSHRLVVTAGKFAASDHFDANAYANNARTQFLNKTFANNTAWDFAQDLRGYSNGAAVSWVNPDCALRFGSFMMPDSAGGRKFAGDILNNRGDQLEYDRNVQLIRHPKPPMTVRLLGYRNQANMGGYRDAIMAARGSGKPPDITSVRRRGAVKYGWGLNFDQAIVDGGNTGVFGRLGWNDGSTESYCFAECDCTLSLGGQVSGANWGRADNRLGHALARNGISGAHRDYLAAGGAGISVGDGRLRYGEEAIFETYYAYQVSKPVTVSLDYQAISNPAYNRDRGLVSVLSLGLHGEF